MFTTNKQTKETTREKILNTTIQLIEKNGYSNTGIREICKTADVSVSRVNYHFGNKDNLILEIAKIIPTQISAELARRSLLGFAGISIFNFPFMIMLIKILFSDGEYAKKYREIYSQPFVKDHIAESYRQAFLNSASLNKEMYSYEMVQILANACGNCMTSLANENLFQSLKLDVDSTIDAVCRFSMMLIKMSDEEQNKLLAEAYEVTKDIKFEIFGIANVKFY